MSSWIHSTPLSSDVSSFVVTTCDRQLHCYGLSTGPPSVTSSKKDSMSEIGDDDWRVLVERSSGERSKVACCLSKQSILSHRIHRVRCQLCTNSLHIPGSPSFEVMRESLTQILICLHSAWQRAEDDLTEAGGEGEEEDEVRDDLHEAHQVGSCLQHLTQAFVPLGSQTQSRLDR